MIPTANIYTRVFRIQHNGKTASSYTVEKGDDQYLVTASHVFDGSVKIPEIEIFHDSTWKSIRVETVYNSLENGDTIVFKLPYPISPKLPIILGPDGLQFGTSVAFLGFPFGLSTPDKNVNNNFPIPFVKGAILSSMNGEKEGITTIYLDGHNNKGFSGGPVVICDHQKKITQVFGTISGYMLEHPLHSETKDEIKSHEINAGIIEAFWINDILDRL